MADEPNGRVSDFTEREENLKPFEVVGYVHKRYTTIVLAKDMDDALSKGSDLVHVNGIDIEDSWDEDYEYYDASVDNARQLDDDQVERAEALRKERDSRWGRQNEISEAAKAIREELDG